MGPHMALMHVQVSGKSLPGQKHSKQAYLSVRRAGSCMEITLSCTEAPCAEMQECFATSTLAQLRERLGAAYHDIDVFAIDEAQFFPDLLAFCTSAADAHAKHLLLAGLDGDFRRQRFGQARCCAPCFTKAPALICEQATLLQAAALNLAAWLYCPDLP